MSIDTARVGLLRRIFEERFGGNPQLWARAPGRVDLMGSHTDYNLGYVLTLPIGRDTWIAARPRADGVVRVYTRNLECESTFRLDPVERDMDARWSNYVRGVAAVLQEAGLALRGFDGVIDSTVPVGSGLSSSAALECATAVVFQTLGGWKLDPARMARLCQKAENEFVGVNCGILDQFTSCAGRENCALLLDCRDLSSRVVAMPEALSVVICDTRAKRELTGSEYSSRRAQCEEGARKVGAAALRDVSLERLMAARGALTDSVYKRCRFIIEENARVLALSEALGSGDLSGIRRLCAESFEGASTLYEIGAPAMLAMMDAMLAAPGVVGARQAGAGFGGCMAAFVETEMVNAFRAAVQERYERTTGIHPETYAVRGAAGAEVFTLP